MKNWKNLIVVAVATLMFTACNNANKTDEKVETTTTTPDDNPVAVDTSSADMNKSGGEAAGKNVVYTCSMHPEVVSDKPGKCPKCEMDLIVKK